MGKNILRVATIVLLSVALFSTQQAEAQFLQKLAKGLEKVNNTLDKVEDGVEEIKNNPLTSTLFKKRKTTTKVEQPSSNSTEQSAELSMAESVAVADEPKVYDESDYEEVEPRYHRPYIGPNTKYMILNDLYQAVNPVYEDIFAIKDGSYYSFWNVDGTKLYDAEWEYCNEYRGIGNEIPQFNSGVLAARNRKPNSTGQKVISLLYVDGSVRELDPTWKEVTTFRDGLALVTKGSYDKEYFYIDIAGKKQYPNLKDVYGGEKNSMRPLRDDRRAFCRLVWGVARWGFIDSKGNEIIPTQYLRVDDFSEGYAWAIDAKSQFTSEGELLLINTKGEVVYRDTDIYADVTPVKNGRFFKRSDDLWTLYDTTGKRLKMYSTAYPFYDGYALVEAEVGGSSSLCIIDPNGTIVRQITEFSESDLSSTARFSKHGVMPIEISWGNNAYINYLGDIIMRHDCQIWPFTECGYALVNLEDDAIGIINLEGELQWIFHTKMAEYWDRGELPILPTPQPPYINDPTPEPWPPIEIDKNGPAIGPKVVVPTRYPVRVQVDGEGSAWVSPDQKDFAYGDVVMLHTEPAEGWKLASVRIYGGNRTAPTEELIRVTEERTYIVKFIKKDDDLPPPFDNAYLGERVFEMEDFNMPVRIYAEISSKADISTPYGDNTYGFIVAMFNPRERIVTEEFATNIFSAPLRISGYHYNEATGERWLVADGGSVTFGNLKITPNDGFAMLWINMIMSVNDYSSPQVTPRHYRIEMLDYNEETGEFTCGRLQTYSSEYGWLDGGDERLTKKSEGFLMTKHDSGIPADFFMGAKMRKSERRTDIDWYPPLNWYDDDQSILDGIINSMKYEYGNYKSEYDEIFN